MMPKVGEKRYAYNDEGEKAAKAESKRTGLPIIRYDAKVLAVIGNKPPSPRSVGAKAGKKKPAGKKKGPPKPSKKDAKSAAKKQAKAQAKRNKPASRSKSAFTSSGVKAPKRKTKK